jgi:hypothetical protein
MGWIYSFFIIYNKFILIILNYLIGRTIEIKLNFIRFDMYFYLLIIFIFYIIFFLKWNWG